MAVHVIRPATLSTTLLSNVESFPVLVAHATSSSGRYLEDEKAPALNRGFLNKE